MLNKSGLYSVYWIIKRHMEKYKTVMWIEREGRETISALIYTLIKVAFTPPETYNGTGTRWTINKFIIQNADLYLKSRRFWTRLQQIAETQITALQQLTRNRRMRHKLKNVAPWWGVPLTSFCQEAYILFLNHVYFYFLPSLRVYSSRWSSLLQSFLV